MKVISSCVIQKNEIILNDNSIFIDLSQDFDDFIKNAYNSLLTPYSKFFKMDALSKLAIVGSSLLFDNQNNEIDATTALVFSNKSSCIDIDIKHNNTIIDAENYFPSPVNFVYTLPNISIGEVSIKYNLKTESVFFIFEQFEKDFLIDYAGILLKNNRANSVLIGWIDVNKNKYEAFFYLLSQN